MNNKELRDKVSLLVAEATVEGAYEHFMDMRAVERVYARARVTVKYAEQIINLVHRHPPENNIAGAEELTTKSFVLYDIAMNIAINHGLPHVAGSRTFARMTTPKIQPL